MMLTKILNVDDDSGDSDYDMMDIERLRYL